MNFSSDKDRASNYAEISSSGITTTITTPEISRKMHTDSLTFLNIEKEKTKQEQIKLEMWQIRLEMALLKQLMVKVINR